MQAARHEATVALCEEHGEIGVPPHCTGHISLTGIRRLKLNLPKEVFENEIKAAVFHSPSGYRFSIRFASPVTCVVNRTLFDRHLAEMAADAGVSTLKNARAESLLVERGFFKGVVIKQERKIKKLTSKIVIDAEGVSSSLLKRAGLPSLDPSKVISGVQAEVDKVGGIEEDTVEVFLSNKYASGFFAWIVPKHDGTAKLGLGTVSGNPRDCLNSFIRHNLIASQRLKHSHIRSLAYHPIPLGGPISRTFHSGLLVVGDAASQVKPTTGGGIVMGLTCAKIAGKVAAYAVHYRDSSAFFLSEYERRWRKEIGFDMMAMKRIRMTLNNLTDRQLDRLVALCTRVGLDETLKHVEDIDFQGTSLVGIVKSPRLLATALYLLKAAFL
jgi:geranylgeranyl reductase family protein